MTIAASLAGNALSILGTDTLLGQFTSGVRSAAGKAGAFRRLKRGLSHVGNGMLQIDSSGHYELLPFSHEYFGRNPIPVNFNSKATCPKFRQLLEDQVAASEDRSLIQRWMGSCLLEGNAANG